MAKKTSLVSAAKKKSESEEKPVIKKTLIADDGIKKRINAEIPLGLHNQFKAKCSMDGREMREVLIELIEEYLGS